jgi:hypothetical protein
MLLSSPFVALAVVWHAAKEVYGTQARLPAVVVSDVAS